MAGLNKMKKNDLLKVTWPINVYKGTNVYHLQENEVLVVLSSQNIKRMNNMVDHKIVMYSTRIGSFDWTGNNIALNSYFQKIA